MRGLLAPLSPNEEAALRRIGQGREAELDTVRLRRLLQLDLVDWSDGSWRLTAIGSRRYAALIAGERAGDAGFTGHIPSG